MPGTGLAQQGILGACPKPRLNLPQKRFRWASHDRHTAMVRTPHECLQTTAPPERHTTRLRKFQLVPLATTRSPCPVPRAPAESAPSPRPPCPRSPKAQRRRQSPAPRRRRCHSPSRLSPEEQTRAEVRGLGKETPNSILVNLNLMEMPNTLALWNVGWKRRGPGLDG